MFTPVSMRNVNIFVDEEDVENAAIALARFEAFHLESSFHDTGREQETTRWGSLTDRYTSQNQQLYDLFKTLEIEPGQTSPPQRFSPGDDVDETGKILDNVKKQIDDWTKRKKEVEEKVRHLNYLVKEMELLEPLDLPVEEIRNPSHMHWVVGTMPRENLESLRLALFEHPEQTRRSRSKAIRRINIFIPESEVEPATLALLKSKNFKPIKTTGKQWADKSSQWNALAGHYGKLLDRIEALMDNLGIEHPHVPLSERTAANEEYDEIAGKLDELEKTIGRWEEQKSKKEHEIRNTDELIRTVRLFESIDIPLEALRKGTYLHWMFARMPKDRVDSLQMTASGMPLVFVPLDTADEQVLIAGATTKKHAQVFDTLAEELDMVNQTIPEKAGTPAEILETLDQRRQDCMDRLTEIKNNGRQHLSGWRQQLSALWSRTHTNTQVAATISEFALHGDMFLISGQIPESSVDDILITVENATGGRADVDILESSKERDLPIEVMFCRVPFVVLPVSLTDRGDRLLVVAATAKKYSNILESAVRGVFLEPVTLPENVTGKPSEILSDLRQRLDSLHKQLDKLKQERRELGSYWGRKLLAFRQQIHADLNISRTINGFSRHESVFLISGWVPETLIDSLVTRIETAADKPVDIETVEPKPGGRRLPPTLMRNPVLLRPFETIVGTFGTPNYGEIDPTPLSALTFCLMYGVMFGDVGHGLILALFGISLYLKTRNKMARGIGGIFTGSGVCAMVFGTFYGSLFGREDIIPGLWIAPLDGIIELIRFSIMGGVALLTLGFCAAMANALRARDWGSFLFGHSGIAGFWFYWALIGGGYGLIRGMMPLWIELVLLAIPAAILLFHAPLAGWINRTSEHGSNFQVESVFELLEAVISNFTNTLSFVRLGAFAVAHAGLMHIVFMLAERSGPVFSWVIITIGTILVIGFEGLVVAIQALRLEYYEFFSRFFSGQGVAFEPFRLARGQKG